MTITPDLVPSVTSRPVTIDVVKLDERTPGDGFIDFYIPSDLRVPADGKLIQASRQRVTLVDGKGSVPLPTFDPDVADPDWVILVKKSWAPRAYPIRVPVGTAPINLAALPPVTMTTAMQQFWGLTGLSVTVIGVGSNEDADGSATVSGGVGALTIKVPRGAPGLGGALEQTTDGTYKVVASSSTTSLDSVAAAMGFYLLPGPSTGETTRNGLPVFWIEKA